MELPKKITDEIWDYCRLNGITDINSFTIKMVSQGFTIEKYGATPSERIVEKVVEKIIEVPVEKIVEKEVVKEVEKIVEKEIYVTNDETTNLLTTKIEELEKNIVVLNEKIRTILAESNDKTTSIVNLNNELDLLKIELSAEKAKPKQETKKDIYGEGKIGFFGSNTNDI